MMTWVYICHIFVIHTKRIQTVIRLIGSTCATILRQSMSLFATNTHKKYRRCNGHFCYYCMLLNNINALLGTSALVPLGTVAWNFFLPSQNELGLQWNHYFLFHRLWLVHAQESEPLRAMLNGFETKKCFGILKQKNVMVQCPLLKLKCPRFRNWSFTP